MKRLLISLPIALLLAILIISPCQAISPHIINIDASTHIRDAIIADTNVPLPANAYADNVTLPDGLKLTAGVPFISPSEVSKGDAVTIKIKATNESAVAINYALILKINEKNAGTQQIALGPAESQNATFPYVAQDAGTNSVKVGTLTGSFNVKGGGFFDLLPTYVWIFLGVVLGVVVMLVVLLITKPARKKGDASSEQPKRTGKQKGKGGKPLGPGADLQMPVPGQMPRPGMQGMPGMAGMQEGGPSGMPFPGQQPPAYDMMGQGPSGMPPQFPGPAQPGMPPQFPGQMQPGVPPIVTPGAQQPPMRTPQYPPSPHVTPGMQPPPPTPGMPGVLPGMGHPQVHGMPSQGPPSPYVQPGGPFGVQPPAVHPPHVIQPPGQPGMPPPIQPTMGPGMQPPPHPVAQAPIPSGFQSGGMPKFSVSNLTITPSKVKVGEPVNISIIVSNNGIQTGKYSVVLRIGGVVENISDLTMPPGASQTASFTVIKDVAGDYYADVDGLGGFFTIIPLAPPAYTTTNFSITPERVRQGQPVVISASVTNMGEITGTHSLILRIKGMAESQQEVTLGPGKTQNVEFQVAKDTPGFYPVSLESWTGKFVVEMDWSG